MRSEHMCRNIGAFVYDDTSTLQCWRINERRCCFHIRRSTHRTIWVINLAIGLQPRLSNAVCRVVCVCVCVCMRIVLHQSFRREHVRRPMYSKLISSPAYRHHRISVTSARPKQMGRIHAGVLRCSFTIAGLVVLHIISLTLSRSVRLCADELYQEMAPHTRHTHILQCIARGHDRPSNRAGMRACTT